MSCGSYDLKVVCRGGGACSKLGAQITNESLKSGAQNLQLTYRKSSKETRS